MFAGKNPWLLVAAGGFAATVVALIMVIGSTGEFIPPVIIFAVLLAALAFSVVRWGPAKRWVVILVAVLGALTLIVNLPFVVEDIPHPETFWSFFPSTLAIIGILLGVAACIAYLVHAGRTASQVAWIGAAAIAGVLLMVSVVATLSLSDDPEESGDVAVTAKDAEYPDTLTAKAGAVAFSVSNKDRIRHTFVIEDQDEEGDLVKQELPASTRRRVEITLTPGTYRFYCDVPGHDSMEGTLTVQ